VAYFNLPDWFVNGIGKTKFMAVQMVASAGLTNEQDCKARVITGDPRSAAEAPELWRYLA
jgi:hypothetical protein